MADSRSSQDCHFTNPQRTTSDSSSSETLSLLSFSDSSKHKDLDNTENKENMSDNSDAKESSLNLKLDETQNVSQESHHDSFSSSHQQGSHSPNSSDGPKWSDKLKILDKDKLKFQSSSSASPSVTKPSLDESITVISDSPQSRNISIIDISDTSFSSPKDDFHLVLDETPKGSHSKETADSGPLSEILVTNTLLYQDCDNIENDEDVQSMKEILELDQSNKEDVSDFIINKTQEAQSWSPKQKIWSGSSASGSVTNERKRKAEAASLSSTDESCKKKLDSKLASDGSSVRTVDKSCEAEDERSNSHLGKSSDSCPDSSRPGSSPAVPLATSLSPIPQLMEEEGGAGGKQRNSTSTPLTEKNAKKTGLSSPQKLIRKKYEENRNKADNSSEDENNFVDKPERSKKSKQKSPNNDESSVFKEPSLLLDQRTRSFTAEDAKTWDLPKVKELLEELKSLGIEPTETPVSVKKRLSDGSSISAGGSSGYLGGSSSGVTSSSGTSSQRSRLFIKKVHPRQRLSIAPETKIEQHGVIPPLPSVPVNNCKDNVSSPTDDKDVTQVASPQKGENPESSAPETVVKVPGKKGRKPKVATESKEKKNKKVLSKKKDDNIARDSASVNEDQEAEVDDKYAVNSKVFARWGDSTGVYFYPAVITQIINNEQVKVTFLEDKIKKPLKKETEIVTVCQLRPGMGVTVKHDIYTVYDVTAILTKYPTRRGSEIEYEVKISATDSEPGTNEEVRLVTHRDITLTDSQAGEILRDAGVTLESTTIASKIDLSNLIFSERKRKTRGGPVTPSSSDTVKTPRRKRGGEHCEESAATTHESSAAEVSPRKTPRSTRLTTPTPRRQRRLLQSTDEDDDEEEVVVKKSQSSSSRRESKAKTEIFWGLSFILTHSKESGPSPTEANYDSLSDNDKEVSKPVISEPKFDKKVLRTAITAHGGNIVTEVSEDNLDTTLVGVSDRECKTMNFLQCLAHGVPLVSHIYILDCVRSGKLLERAAYLLPAGFSVLLMKNVEQLQDYKHELNVNGCLLPYPPATGTRQSARVKTEDNHRKVLSGLHVLVISTDKHFTEDWQSVLVSLGASVTGVHVSDTRLRDIRPPDVVVTDSKAPTSICKDVDQHEYPIVSTNWIIQCTINNARIAYNNFKCKLPI